MLASEFGESTLNEKGSGEFDPTFVITKLGAKVNRVIVSGLVERLELRETSNGSQMYQGQLRDPSGLHRGQLRDGALFRRLFARPRWRTPIEECDAAN